MNMTDLNKKLEKAQAAYSEAVASITLDELLEGVTCPVKAAKIDKAVSALGRIKSTIAVREEAARLKAKFMDATA